MQLKKKDQSLAKKWQNRNIIFKKKETKDIGGKDKTLQTKTKQKQKNNTPTTWHKNKTNKKHCYRNND